MPPRALASQDPDPPSPAHPSAPAQGVRAKFHPIAPALRPDSASACAKFRAPRATKQKAQTPRPAPKATQVAICPEAPSRGWRARQIPKSKAARTHAQAVQTQGPNALARGPNAVWQVGSPLARLVRSCSQSGGSCEDRGRDCPRATLEWYLDLSFRQRSDVGG